MIKRQSVLLSSLLLFGHRHYFYWGCCLMASASASSLIVIGNRDPLILFSSKAKCSPKGLHIQSSLNQNRVPDRFENFLSPRKASLLSSVDTITTTGDIVVSLRRINGRFINGVCCCSSSNRDGLRISADNNNNNNNINSNNASHKARAFAPYLPHLLRDCDKIGHEEYRDGMLFNEDGLSGSSIRFPDKPLTEKVIVAVDVDEVLGNFVSALNQFIADRYTLNHSVSEYHVYEFFKIWKCSRAEADIRVHEFFKTAYFKSGIHPIPGARRALQKLSRFCNLSVVTSRQNAIKDHTIEWIERHYAGLFQGIHFGNHFALDGQSRPKSDICRSLGAKVLIDDNPRYAIECAEVGIRVLLFDFENSYPWCKTESVIQHPLVTKVRNWEEVEHQIVSFARHT